MESMARRYLMRRGICNFQRLRDAHHDAAGGYAQGVTFIETQPATGQSSDWQAFLTRSLHNEPNANRLGLFTECQCVRIGGCFGGDERCTRGKASVLGFVQVFYIPTPYNEKPEVSAVVPIEAKLETPCWKLLSA